MYCDLFDPSDDANASVDKLGDTIGNLYAELWDKHKKQHYGNAPFNLNVQVFVNLWLSRSMKIFMVYEDDGAPIGFLMGVPLRPFTYEAQVFQIEDWYARTPEAEKALLDYARQAVRLLGCDEVWCITEPGRPLNLDRGWVQQGACYMERWVRS